MLNMDEFSQNVTRGLHNSTNLLACDFIHDLIGLRSLKMRNISMPKEQKITISLANSSLPNMHVISEELLKYCAELQQFNIENPLSDVINYADTYIGTYLTNIEAHLNITTEPEAQHALHEKIAALFQKIPDQYPQLPTNIGQYLQSEKIRFTHLSQPDTESEILFIPPSVGTSFIAKPLDRRTTPVTRESAPAIMGPSKEKPIVLTASAFFQPAQAQRAAQEEDSPSYISESERNSGSPRATVSHIVEVADLTTPPAPSNAEPTQPQKTMTRKSSCCILL